MCGRRGCGGGPLAASSRHPERRRTEGPRCGGDGRTNRKFLRKSFRFRYVLFNRSAHSAVPNLDDLMTGCLDALRIGLRIRRIGRIGRIGRSGRLDRLVGLRGLGGLIGLDGFGGSGGLGGLDENRWKSLIIYEKSNRSTENR